MLLLDFCSAAVVKALYVVVVSRVFCSAAAFIFVIYVASNDVIAPAAAVRFFLFPPSGRSESAGTDKTSSFQF